MMKNTVFIFSLSITLGIWFSVTSQAEQSKSDKSTRPGLSSLDKNGDKTVTEAEAGPVIWARLGKLDKNGDGKIAGDEFPRSGLASGKGKAGEFLKRMDKNGDGNLSKEEVPPQAWEKLGKLDTNSDNSISKQELAAAASKGRTESDFFGKIDKNSDGKITENEAPKFWGRLSKADKNKDGAVSQEEMQAARAYAGKTKGIGMTSGGRGKSTGSSGAIFTKYDEDGDGKLSKEEVPEELWSKLSRADNNADGLVSRDELSSVYQKMQGMRPTSENASKPKRPAMENVDA